MKYADKLKDPRWQKMRLQVFERDKFTCRRCYESDKTLHAHHVYYDKNKNPWDYEQESIVTLCEDCHQDEHTHMDNVISSLIYTVKKNFLFYENVSELAIGIETMEHVHLPEIEAAAIQYMLSNKYMMHFIVDNFWKVLPGMKKKHE